MKTLIFSLAYYPDYVGGAEVAIKEITDKISEKDMSFDMITLRLNKRQSKFEKIGNINVYRVGFGFLTLDKFSAPIDGFFKAFRLNKEEKYDFLWAMMANQMSVAAALFKIFNKKIPLILSVQEGDEEKHLKRYVGGNDFLYRIFIRPWHLMIFKLADRATVISRYLEERVLQNNFKGPIFYVPNGVDMKNFSKKEPEEKLEELKKSLGLEKTDRIIITTSRLVEKNRVEDIILSLNYLSPEYKALILGSGHLLYKLQNLAEKEKLLDRVKFLGFIDRSEIPKYLALSDVFVRPSLSEGMGVSFIEAMASNLPVVATPVGGIVDFLKDEETGLFCEVKNPKSLAEAVKKIEKNKELRERIIQNAIKMTKERFTWDFISKEMLGSFYPFKDRKKIIIATGVCPPKMGGPSYYAHNLSKEFRGLGQNVKIVTYGMEARLPSGLRHLFYFLKLFLKSLGADFILALDTLSVGLPSAAVRSLTRSRLLIRTGGDFLWEQYIERIGPEILLSRFYESAPKFTAKEKKVFNLTKYVLKRADILLFSTKYQRDIFLNAYGPDISKTRIVENFYGPKKEAFSPRKKIFLWAGRDIRFKNSQRMKEAFALAREENKNIELEIHKDIKQEELFKKMARSYAVMNISIGEISPNFIMEAIAFNKPFILTKETGIYDRVRDIAIFADPMDIKDIKEKILFLADDNNYEAQKKKIERFGFRHSYGEIAEEILKIAGC